MPVAVGVGEGGEFYRPMAVAIIGGTITSTLLTLLVVPALYALWFRVPRVASAKAVDAPRHSLVPMPAHLLFAPDPAE